jgi:hypothetical protein
MMIRHVATIAGFSVGALIASAASCGGGGAGGTGGKGGSAGTTATASTTHATSTTATTATSSTGTGGSSNFPTCTPVMPTASDTATFDFTTAVPPGASWGMFPYWGGGTFEYPEGTAPGDGGAAPTDGVVSEFPNGTWNILGTVKDYSGFGMYLNCKADLSVFTGMQFDIMGTFTGNGVGDGGVSTPQVTLNVSTQPDNVAAQYTTMPTMPAWGTCIPKSALDGGVPNQYDGTCASPTKVIPLTTTLTTTTVKWTDLTGGKPMNSPDVTQITGFAWVLPWGGAGSAQYTVSVTLKNIKFTVN